MISRIIGVVTSIIAERPGAQEIQVRSTEENSLRSALNLTDLTGELLVGDTVVLNTVAVELKLGTGGLDYVVSVTPNRLPNTPPKGHILKLRYTPLQIPVLAVEAPESPYHEAIAQFQSLQELPVICMELHSQLPAVCAGIRWAEQIHNLSRPLKIVYIMTDASALSLPLSRIVPVLKSQNLLSATITIGQAYGGDYEAINLYSGMAFAKEVLNADVIITGQGPGNAGTQTPLGFSGIDQGVSVNAVASLGGTPVLVPRISFAEKRHHHHGMSLHTITILRQVVRAPVWVPIPRLPIEQLVRICTMMDELDMSSEIQTTIIDTEQSISELEKLSPYLSTMGRGLKEETPFFLAGAAAGILAVQLSELYLA